MRREGLCRPSRRIFIPYRHFVPLPPKEEAKFVIASEAKQTPGRVGFRKVYNFHFGRGIFRLRSI